MSYKLSYIYIYMHPRGFNLLCHELDPDIDIRNICISVIVVHARKHVHRCVARYTVIHNIVLLAV